MIQRPLAVLNIDEDSFAASDFKPTEKECSMHTQTCKGQSADKRSYIRLYKIVNTVVGIGLNFGLNLELSFLSRHRNTVLDA